jgi:hypothetical protein
MASIGSCVMYVVGKTYRKNVVWKTDKEPEGYKQGC